MHVLRLRCAWVKSKSESQSFYRQERKDREEEPFTTKNTKENPHVSQKRRDMGHPFSCRAALGRTGEGACPYVSCGSGPNARPSTALRLREEQVGKSKLLPPGTQRSRRRTIHHKEHEGKSPCLAKAARHGAPVQLPSCARPDRRGRLSLRGLWRR